MLFLCYENCSTCKKAEKWLLEQGISYTKRSITQQPPTEEELSLWQQKSGLPFKKFFNTSGKLYRELDLKEKLSTMPEEEQRRLLSQNGMLVKRPIGVSENLVCVGFRPVEWEGFQMGG